MTVESFATLIGCFVSIFALGYTIGYNQSKNRNDRLS